MISIICGVKNRTNALSVSLASWLLCERVSEIIIVDWSSDIPIHTNITRDHRVKVIRVEGQEYFNLSACYNLAASFVTNDFLLKMDCDYVINPYYDFFENLPDENTFITGHWSLNPSPFFLYLNGLVFTLTKHFKEIKGYNENLVDYGYDDDDLYNRLNSIGLNRKLITLDKTKIFHIPHPDSKRTENYKNKNTKNSHSANRQKSNRFSLKYKWEIEKKYDHYTANPVRINTKG